MSRFGIKALLVAVVAFALSTVASAQSINTFFSNNYFSATFDSVVTAEPASRNNENTSSDYLFHSETPAIWEGVNVRIVDHDIPVGFQSTDFYADNQARQASGDSGIVISRSQTYYQGHPVTYICTSFADRGQTYWVRTRYILVNARVTIWVKMISLQADSDQNEWERFENSVTIK